MFIVFGDYLIVVPTYYVNLGYIIVMTDEMCDFIIMV